MTARPPFWRLQTYEALASTSDLCRELAARGEPEGLAIRAARQTAGRGTHGRTWESPEGNLYLSLLLRPRIRVAEAPQFGLLAAVAMAETLAPAIQPDRRAGLRLKWPNDVTLAGAKLAGILVEASADMAGDVEWLVIGMGANLAVAPQVPGRPTACLGEGAPAPDVFAAGLLGRIAAWRDTVMADGFAPLHEAWLALGPRPGDKVAVRRGERSEEGCFAGLSRDGALLLRAEGMIRVFATGET